VLEHLQNIRAASWPRDVIDGIRHWRL